MIGMKAGVAKEMTGFKNVLGGGNPQTIESNEQRREENRERTTYIFQGGGGNVG